MICEKCGSPLVFYPAFSFGALNNQNYDEYKLICPKCRTVSGKKYILDENNPGCFKITESLVSSSEEEKPESVRQLSSTQKPFMQKLIYCPNCKDFRDFTYSNNEHYNCKTCGNILGFDRKAAERVANGKPIYGGDDEFCFQWSQAATCIYPVTTKKAEEK